MMEEPVSEELAETLTVILDILNRCEKAQLGLAAGSPQHSLLKNRIKALKVVKVLILETGESDNLRNEELLAAISPVCSIISKCEKAQRSFAEGTSQYIRLSKMLTAMRLAKSLISDHIRIRGL